MSHRSSHRPYIDQLSVLTATLALVYTLARFLDLPTRLVETSVLGYWIAFQVDGQSISLLLVTAIITTGCDSMIRSHPRISSGQAGTSLATYWIIPSMAALVVGRLLAVVHMGPAWLLSMATGVLFLTLLLLAEYGLVDPSEDTYKITRLWMTIMAYVTVLCMFDWLMGATAASSIMVSVISGLISFRLLVLYRASYSRACRDGVVIGVMLGGLSWMFSNWAIPPLGVSLLLITILHVCTGLIQCSLTQPIPRRIWLEYGAVAAVAAFLVLELTPRI